MLGLNFYPQADVFHTAFRAVCIAKYANGLPIDAYRIFDYFVTFPFDLTVFRRRGGQHKRIAEFHESDRPYKWKATPASAFLQMSQYQTMALTFLVNRSVIDHEKFSVGLVKLSSSFALSPQLSQDVASFLDTRTDVLDFLNAALAEFGVNGEGGLKDRSTLMSHRYDARQHVVFD